MINNKAIDQLNQQKSYQNVPVNGTANEIASNLEDNKSLSQGDQASLNSQQNGQPVTQLTKKRKMIIVSVVVLAIFIITGTILGVYFSQKQDSSQIQIPPNYVKYEKQINSGQENNIVKLIHVPQAQLTYEYKLQNNQIVELNQKTEGSNSVITHQIHLLCSDVDEQKFTMYMYFSTTKMFDNGNLQSEFGGFSEQNLKKQDNKVRRNLEEQQNHNNDESLNVNLDDIQNEYGNLTEHEIELLNELGISADQYIQSSWPIIKFTLLKTGNIQNIQIPINLRYDIRQVYLNILEQLAPKLNSDLYNVVDKQNGKHRLLSEKKMTYTKRTLSDTNVVPEHVAIIEGDKGNLQTSYGDQINNENHTVEKFQYTQNQFMLPGGLQQTKVNSVFELQDNKAEKNEQLVKKIEMISECTIQFISQLVDVGDKFLQLVKNTQANMSIINYTYEQAVNSHIKLFKTSKIHAKEADQRQLQEEKPQTPVAGQKSLGDVVKKSIFTRNFSQLEIGASIKSECFQADLLNKEDFCNVSLLGNFNGKEVQVIQKQVQFNVSKILKYYQYIVSTLDKGLDVAVDLVDVKLENISKSLQTILDRTEELIDIKKNPLTKELDDIISNDSLQIISQINNFETILTKSIQGLNSFLQNPMGEFKKKIFDFLSQKQIEGDFYQNKVKDFVSSKYGELSKYIDSQQKGINQVVVAKITSFLQSHDAQIQGILGDKLKGYSVEIQNFIKAKATEILTNTKLINLAFEKITDSAQSLLSNKVKEFLLSAGVNDYIEKTIKETIAKLTENTAQQEQLSQNILKQLNDQKAAILMKLVNMGKNKQVVAATSPADAAPEKTITDLQTIQNTIKLDIAAGFETLKKDAGALVGELAKQFATDVKNNIIEFAKALLPFPTKLIETAVTQGKNTITKVKEITQRIKTNTKAWSQDMVGASNLILTDIKKVYENLKSMINNPILPTADGLISKNSMYEDVENIFVKVSALVALRLEGHTNLMGIKEQIKRIKLIPQKVTTFVKDLKQLGEKSFTYYETTKTSLQNINTEGQALYATIKDLINQARQKFSSQEAKRMLQETELVETFNGLESDSEGVINGIVAFDAFLKTQGIDVKKILQQKMLDLAATLKYQKSVKTPELTFPLEYVQYFPTPIGIAIKLHLQSKWVSQIQFNIDYNNAKLNLVTILSANLQLSGSVGGSVYIAEVGGYVEGNVLDGKINTEFNTYVLDKFRGDLNITAQLNPWSMKAGIYYSTIFSKESLDCMAQIAAGIGGVKKQEDPPVKTGIAELEVAKEPANTTPEVLTQEQLTKLKQATMTCVKAVVTVPKKNFIVQPYELKGEKQYNFEIYKTKWDQLNIKGLTALTDLTQPKK